MAVLRKGLELRRAPRFTSSRAIQDAIVAFYGSDDCNPANVISEGDTGCLVVPTYKSFVKVPPLITGLSLK